MKNSPVVPRLAVVIAALHVAIAAHASVPDHKLSSHQTPLLIHHGNPGVAVMLDGETKPLYFLIDTAAGASLIDNVVAKRLGLKDDSKQKVKVQGASGASNGLSWTVLNRVSFGNLTLPKLRAISTTLNTSGDAPDSKYDGIIGNDVLRNFDVVIDIPAKTLELRSPSASDRSFDGPECQANAGNPSHLAGFSFLNVALAEKPGTKTPVVARAVVDTGSPLTILNWSAARAMGLLPGDPLFAKSEGLRGLDINLHSDTVSYTLSSLRIGSWRSSPLKIQVVDLPVFKALGLDEQPALILGADVLGQQRLAISKGAKRICFGNDSGIVH